MTDQKVRVRFAPSPTGDPHFGTLRTALFNYLFARHEGGTLVLRIEDTDKTREIAGSEQKMERALAWLGLEPDEGPAQGGPYGPYRQSERTDLYRKYAEDLIESGHAYYCFCTPERLDSVRKEQEAKHQPPRYDRHCRTIPKEEAKRRAEIENHVIRLTVPDGQAITWNDLIKREVTFQSSEIDDQVLLKSDGYPTYHLANVVDDHLMHISHVIRGEDWLSSTPKHLLLYTAFGWEVPQFAHLPLILGPDKSKLSKRHGDTSILYYQEHQGYVPAAVVHFMAFLGWTPEHVREPYTLEQLVRDFTLERVGASPAIFDQTRLDSLGQQYLAAEEIHALYGRFLDWLIRHAPLEGTAKKEFFTLSQAEPPAAEAMLDVVRMRSAHFMACLEGLAAFFNQDQVKKLAVGDLTLDGKIDPTQAIEALKAVKTALVDLDVATLSPDAADRITTLQEYFRAHQPKDLGGQAYLHPTRVALTGSRQSMNMFEYLAGYLMRKEGKQLMLHRFDQAMALLES